jgi:hypothetical protein
VNGCTSLNIAWSKGAIRAILTNPRYTGYQVWNKQRKAETLLDVDDVALGYENQDVLEGGQHLGMVRPPPTRPSSARTPSSGSSAALPAGGRPPPAAPWSAPATTTP